MKTESGYRTRLTARDWNCGKIIQKKKIPFAIPMISRSRKIVFTIVMSLIIHLNRDIV